MQEFEEENVPTGALFMTLGVTAFFTVAIILGLTGLYEGLETYHADKWAGVVPADTQSYQAEQASTLSEYQKAEDDSLRIPIDRSMELVLQERR